MHAVGTPRLQSRRRVCSPGGDEDYITRHVRAPGASHHGFDEPFERARPERVPVVLGSSTPTTNSPTEATAGRPSPRLPQATQSRWSRRTMATHSRTPLSGPCFSGLGVGRLVVVGAQTDWCVRSTLHGALARATTRPSSAMRIRRKTRLIGRRRRRTRSSFCLRCLAAGITRPHSPPQRLMML